MKFKFSDYLISWLQINQPTVEGEIYKVKNPLSIFLKKTGTIQLSDGYKIPYNKENKEDVFILTAYALLNGIKFGGEGGWKYDSKNEVVEMHQGIKLKIKGLRLVDETFLYQIHFSGFDLKDKIVITAGAFIGDTPLFYSYYGAKVYGFEPDPRSYELAKENVDINPKLSENIVLKNYAIGRDEEIVFPISKNGSSESSIYKSNQKTVLVKSVSISTILQEFNISEPYLLDLDIKGSEFDVIDQDSIKRFHKVRIEYSPYLINSESKSLGYLINKLKSYGFNKIRIYKHSHTRFDLSRYGTLEAEK